MDMVIVCGIAAFLFGWAFTYGIADGSFDEEVSVLEDNTEGMDMDTELSAEDEALIDEELMEDELDTEEAETEDLDAELAAEDSGGDILPGDTDNFEEIPAGNEDLPPATESGAGLNDACLDSGFSQAACSNYLFSDDPGGYCSTLSFAGVSCPEIQDPTYTYGNPEEALQESQEDIENTERAIQGFDNTVPDDLGEQFAQD
jgi:hypothetical protein